MIQPSHVASAVRGRGAVVRYECFEVAEQGAHFDVADPGEPLPISP